MNDIFHILLIIKFHVRNPLHKYQCNLTRFFTIPQIISQSLTTTIFKRFVVYIEDLRRGFATG